MSILSIQSHVAYGHVGNAAAVFALQRLGLEVWPVMTVQLSNHTGYAGWRGRSFEAEHIAELVRGLEEVGALAACRAVLSGYLGTAEVGEVVLDAVECVKRANPEALYLCDTVMGDHDPGLYVSEEIVEFFKVRALPRAQIITPNIFELELLTERSITSVDQALEAAQGLNARGLEIVVLTSVRFPETDPDHIAVYAVTPAGVWRVSTPWLELSWQISGAGDGIAALFLGHYLRVHPGPDRVPQALSAAASATFAVIEATERAGTRELQLIAAQDKLVLPDRLFAAERID